MNNIPNITIVIEDFKARFIELQLDIQLTVILTSLLPSINLYWNYNYLTPKGKEVYLLALAHAYILNKTKLDSGGGNSTGLTISRQVDGVSEQLASPGQNPLDRNNYYSSTLYGQTLLTLVASEVAMYSV